MNHYFLVRYWDSNHSFFVVTNAYDKRSSVLFTRVGIIRNLTRSTVFFDSITTGQNEEEGETGSKENKSGVPI